MNHCTCDVREQHPASECVAPWETTNDVQQRDVAALLVALGLSDQARPYSLHAVIHRDILPAIRAAKGGTCNAPDCNKNPGHMGAHE